MDGAVEENRRSDRSFIRQQQRADAVQADREIRRGRGVPGSFPGDACVVIPGCSVGVLSADKLEGVDGLQREVVTRG